MSLKSTRSGRTVKPLKRLIDDKEEDKEALETKIASPAKRQRTSVRTNKCLGKESETKTRLVARSTKQGKKTDESNSIRVKKSPIERKKKPVAKVKSKTMPDKLILEEHREQPLKSRATRSPSKRSKKVPATVNNEPNPTTKSGKIKATVSKKPLKADEIAQLLSAEDEEEEEEKEELPSDTESVDTEITFNQNKEKRKPIYMKSFSPEKKQKVKDVYDDFSSEDEEEGSKTKTKKKVKRKPATTKRKPRKQNPGLILAFDANKTQIKRALKQIKNIKTPPTANPKKVEAVNRIKATLPSTADASLPSTAPVQQSTFSSENPQSLSIDEIANDDNVADDVFNSTANPKKVDAVNVMPQIKVTLPSTATKSLQSEIPQSHDEIANDDNIVDDMLDSPPPAQNDPKKQYATPAVSKRSHQMMHGRNASTPRVDDPKPVTKEDLMKNCFGFDDSSNSDVNTTRGSLVGFSPVQSVFKQNNVMETPAQTSTRIRDKSTSSVISSVNPTVTEQRENSSKPMRFNFKMPKVKPATSTTKSFSRYQMKSLRQDSSSVTTVSSATATEKFESSIFDEENFNEDRYEQVLQEVPGVIDATDDRQDEGEVENAFEAMKKKPGKSKKKPLKTVTNTIAKKTKQALIYDESQGGAKVLRSSKRRGENEIRLVIMILNIVSFSIFCAHRTVKSVA